MSQVPDDGVFLTVDHVFEIHREVLEQHGGLDGVRGPALLESAVAAPQASFGGQSLYADLVEVAGAYLFYLCRNHPFLDGNKRAALGACLVCLRLNGAKPRPDGPRWEKLVLGVATGALSREDMTKALRALVATGRRQE